MPTTLRGVTGVISAGAPAAVARPAGTQVGDVAVMLIHGSLFMDSYETIVPGSAGWTRIGATNAFATTAGRAIIYTKRIEASDPATFPITYSDNCHCLVSLATLADAELPTEASLVWGGSGTTSNSLVAPSVTGINGGHLLTMHSPGQNAWVGARTYSVPAGMTRDIELEGNFHVALAHSSQALSVAGATGTRTSTLSGSAATYYSASLVIAPASTTKTGDAAGAWSVAGAASGASPIIVLLPPAGLAAQGVSTSQINLAWSSSSYATGYDIERNGIVIVRNHQGLTYSDTGLIEGTAYTYRVRAVF